MSVNQFVLTCCSTADMRKEYFDRRQIPYVCFHYLLNGETYPDDLGQTVSFETFYDKMAKGAMPTTSQVNVGEFHDFFEGILKEGKDILHISLSSGISGTYQSACAAAKELMEEYPNRRLLVLDSLGASSGYGLLVDAAADIRDRGTELSEAYRQVSGKRLSVHHWFFTTDLTSFKRGGRISATSAMLGTVLGICPLMNIDGEGRLVPRQKIRTKKKAMLEAVRMMEEHARDGALYDGKCFISCSACHDDAGALAALVEERFLRLDGKPLINSIGTVIGAHTGPGTVALFFFGDERLS